MVFALRGRGRGVRGNGAGNEQQAARQGKTAIHSERERERERDAHTHTHRMMRHGRAYAGFCVECCDRLFEGFQRSNEVSPIILSSHDKQNIQHLRIHGINSCSDMLHTQTHRCAQHMQGMRVRVRVRVCGLTSCAAAWSTHGFGRCGSS